MAPPTLSRAEEVARRWGPGLAGVLAALGTHLVLGPSSPSDLVHDAAAYDRLGWALASGEGFVNAAGYPEVLRTPGYPSVLACLYFAFGHVLWPVLGLHAVAHGLSAMLVGRIAERLQLHPWLGSASALAFAVYPFALHGSARILTESVSTLLLLAAVDRLSAKPDRRLWSLQAGLLLGGLALVRPSMALLPLFLVALHVVLALLRRPGSAALARSGLVAVVAVAVMLPWGLRTSSLVGRPVLLGAAGLGNSLFIGSWEYPDLSKGLPSTTDFDQPGYRAEERSLLTEATRRAPRESPAWFVALDDLRKAAGWARIRSHPGLYLRASLIRIPKLWVSQHLPGLPRWAGLISALFGLVTLGLGVGGAVLWLRGRPSGLQALAVLGPVVYLWALHVPLHAEARYTLPVRPLALIFVVYALIRIFSCFRPGDGAAR